MITTAENNIDHIYTKKVGDLHFRNLSVCPVHTPVFEVARLMAKDKISCFFIGDSPNEIIGFVTDITLRDRIIADKLSFDTPVREIMDRNIVYIQDSAFLYEALLMMFRTKTRYLLVKNKDRRKRQPVLAARCELPGVSLYRYHQRCGHSGRA